MKKFFSVIIVLTTLPILNLGSSCLAFAGQQSAVTVFEKVDNNPVQKKTYRHHYRKRYHKKLYRARRHHRAESSIRKPDKKNNLSVFIQSVLKF